MSEDRSLYTLLDDREAIYARARSMLEKDYGVVISQCCFEDEQLEQRFENALIERLRDPKTEFLRFYNSKFHRRHGSKLLQEITAGNLDAREKRVLEIDGEDFEFLLVAHRPKWKQEIEGEILYSIPSVGLEQRRTVDVALYSEDPNFVATIYSWAFWLAKNKCS